MSSTETARGERELYKDTESEGSFVTIEYSGLKLHDVVGLSENNATGCKYPVEETKRDMRLYYVDFSWYRLYDLTSQSETNGHALAKNKKNQGNGEGVQASWKELPLFWTKS